MFSHFAPLWVLAFFLHHAEDWDRGGITLLALLLTVWTTWARDRVLPFALAVGAFATFNAVKSPHLANHAVYYALVCFCLLLWVAGLWVRHRHRLDEARVVRDFEGIRPALCLSLFVVYFMAGFHKLNADFFDPNVSCAADFFLRYARAYDFPESAFPRLLLDYSPHLVVFVELAGAFLLLVPRLQPLGIGSFVLLHSYLVPLSFYDFASICYAILLCFLPSSLFDGEDNHARIGRGVRFLVISMLLGVVVGRFIDDAKGDTSLQPDLVQGWFFLAGSLYLVVQVFRNVRASGMKMGDYTGLNLFAWSRGRPRWMWLMPLGLLIYTWTSYLGLRTAGNTTMFSNLRTEGGRSNHFLVSSRWQVFDFQRDIVWVEEIERKHAREVRRQPRKGMGMTVFELRRVAERWRARGEKVPMTFRHEGRVYRFDDVTQAEEWTRPLPWVAKKLMLFREIQPDGPNRCRW